MKIGMQNWKPTPVLIALSGKERVLNTNKKIFMITDSKPTCLKEGTGYYQNSFGLDRKIINKTLTMAAQARRLNIPITTFMIATDPYLQKFVREKKVKQRVYPKNINVDLKEKKVTIQADRITEFDNLKAATEMKLIFHFSTDDRTIVNPWGVYISKETEEAVR